MVKVRVQESCNYKAVYFNHKTMRIAIDPSKPIKELDHPEFLDVKITDYCQGNCPYCYMDSTIEGLHADNIIGKVKDYFGSMSENERPFQVAIGGGEPTTHPDFIELLKTFHDLGITPNYTSNGMNLTDEIIAATKKYSGGVALSCHSHLDLYWQIAANKFIKAGVKLNFHHVISNRLSITQFKYIYDYYHKSVDHFVLLPYGATGRAPEKEIEWDYLVSQIPEDTSKIAFGANFHPYLKDTDNRFKVSLYEPESMSKFLDLSDMSIHKSSFNLNVE